MPDNNSITDLPEQTVIASADVPLILEFITEAAEHVASAESALLALEKHPNRMDMLDRMFRAFHTIKGVAGFLNLDSIGALAHSTENLLAAARKGAVTLHGKKIHLLFSAVDAARGMLTTLKTAAQSDNRQCAFDSIQELLADLHSAATDHTPDNTQDRHITTCPQDNTAARILTEFDENIKVKIDLLDSLVNAVGELAIAQLGIIEEIDPTHHANQKLLTHTTRQNKLIDELQDISMAMRMVPLEGIFLKLTRLARDLSCKTGKQIQFSAAGGHTEIDRRVAEKIIDPLVHMVRNCIDHGIESPQHRQLAGKSATAAIEIRAFGKSGKICIEIEDDGCGLDKDTILRKAVEKGLVAPDAALSDSEIYKLIFTAGLSTAQVVTDVSGRGVGMDIVKKNIDALHGKIDIATQHGTGTVFTIELPLTLATLRGQIVRIGTHRYILPIDSVAYSLRPTETQYSTILHKNGMIRINEEIMPIVPIQELFNIALETPHSTPALLVVIEDGEKKCAVPVDELLDQQNVVVKNPGHELSAMPGIYGGAILGDGNVTLILDIPGLLSTLQ